MGDKYVRQNAKGADALTLKRAGDKALRQVFPFMPMPNTSAAAKQKGKAEGRPVDAGWYDKIAGDRLRVARLARTTTRS